MYNESIISYKTNKIVAICIIVYFFLLCGIAFYTDGTCDSGDSITHYLYSKYAFQHPENFLNHWAKPFFVFLSAPFAQFGFIGIKLFNCILSCLCIWFTYSIAKKLNYNYAFLAPLFLAFTPGFFIHTFSGLTEPLFACILTFGILLVLNNQFVFAAALISFLPFVRSEGLIIIAVFAFYFLISKNYKYLVWLLFGNILYSIIGYWYYHDLFWVFTKIPYSQSSGKYGSGNLSHFVIQLNYVIGVPIYMLFTLGLIAKIILIAKTKSKRTIETWLIYGSFITYFIAHTLFWYFGIFESMGLKRVLVAVVPLCAIIALQGLNFISNSIRLKKLNQFICIAIACYIILFMFVSNPASVNWKKDLSASPDEKLVNQIADYIAKSYPNNNFIFYTHPYVSLAMKKDPFSKTDNEELKNYGTRLTPSKFLIIWDNWFSIVENGVQLKTLANNKQLKEIKRFEYIDNDRNYKLVLFENN